ncbi:MAG: YihY/virulence factor BrkB family protein [Tissierellia bacterium]|nr:YihY/virulence factor BrkB family protein [Tissierellia bacterium]
MNKIREFKTKIINKLQERPSTRTIYIFLKTLFANMKKTNFSYASSFLAYSLLLSMIPMLIFLSQILSFVTESFDDSVFELISYLPDSTSAILNPLFQGMISLRSSGISILALWSWLWLGSRGFAGLVQTLNEIFNVNKNKSFIFEKVFGIIYLILFTLVLMGLLFFNVFNTKIINFLEQFTSIREVLPRLYGFLVNGFVSISPVLMMTVLFLFLYKFVPATDKEKKIPFDAAIVGAAFTSLAIIIITKIYSYTQDLSSMNIYYGSMAGILALLVWLLMICQSIILGAEVIASIMELKKSKI